MAVSFFMDRQRLTVLFSLVLWFGSLFRFNLALVWLFGWLVSFGWFFSLFIASFLTGLIHPVSINH